MHCALRDDVARASSRDPSRELSMVADELELCLGRSARCCGGLDCRINIPRIPDPNVKSNTTPESYIFQWFFAFLIRN
jgi:hypothetical protein